KGVKPPPLLWQKKQQPPRTRKPGPLPAGASQNKPRRKTKGKKHRRHIRALNQVQADTPQAKPCGREDKKAGNNGN
ncbi:hypothetical protein, partial [Pseudomonas aeruginosa]|uniref:hypothetical protein n=1 Tax=Pseudomonas aeruginosa TaxID=287 RepID=UPI001E61F54D